MFLRALPEKITVSGIEVGWFTKGAGRPLIYLHSGDGVDGTEEFLLGLSSHFKVMAASHPGFADWNAPAHFNSVDDLSYFYLDLLEKLDVKDAILVGASFGGWVAAELAVKSDRFFSRIVMIDPVGLKFGSRETREFPDLFSKTAGELPGLFFKDAQRGRAAYANLDFEKAGMEAATRFARNRESLALYSWSPRLHNPKLIARLQRIRVPTLVLWGDSDTFASPEYGRSYAKAIPGATFKLIADAGHYAHIEQPRQVVKSITEFAGIAQPD